MPWLSLAVTVRPVKVLSFPAILVGLFLVNYEPLFSTGIDEARTSLSWRLDAVLIGSSLPTVLAMSFFSIEALIDDWFAPCAEAIVFSSAFRGLKFFSLCAKF